MNLTKHVLPVFDALFHAVARAPSAAHAFPDTSSQIQIRNGHHHATDFDRADNQHRPPLGKAHAPSGKPLIVTPTFVSRVDDTPRGERPQDSGSARSRHGHEVHLPNWRAGALAIEGDPNLAFEHWDEYWRKVHGPKFAWDEPGSSSELVVRYDQLHRIASGPSSGFPLPYRAMIDENGLLPSDPWKRVPEFKRPRWDGLAYIAYAEEADIERTLGQDKFGKRIIADEQTELLPVSWTPR